MYADLEESFGSFKTTKAVYDRIIDLKIATPLIIMNYGMFLEENNYFEEMFKVSMSHIKAYLIVYILLDCIEQFRHGAFYILDIFNACCVLLTSRSVNYFFV